MLPAKVRLLPDNAGAVPLTQLRAVLQLLFVPAPLHVKEVGGTRVLEMEELLASFPRP